MKRLFLLAVLTFFTNAASAALIATLEVKGDTLDNPFTLTNLSPAEAIESLSIDATPFTFDSSEFAHDAGVGINSNALIPNTSTLVVDFVSGFTNSLFSSFTADLDNGRSITVEGKDLVGTQATLTTTLGTYTGVFFIDLQDAELARVEFFSQTVPVSAPATAAMFALLAGGLVLRRRAK
ncbi:hypothetical protein HR060_10300 [Catenovulum sp. SM1970]|uniref:hypothetical protein n=1 Tax=Marinifaba aquimaris TaxID=2741323 RepID=UPI00157195AE|nr:hypothetical protein [Marinifaba aquimaris]NTS77254.1 hypothetical protein [Marinifaba aquimaris]